MRCYTCNGFGNKAQDCWNSRSQPMKNTPYSSGRKSNKDWNKKRDESVKSQWANSERKSRSQKWIERKPKLSITKVIDSCQKEA